ncbi:hypothetical protein Asp14428_28610 [Actinoplanes sp. NBRC 14428]|nr:hypothetical protein Asp14428_28610 [Actinoplanes sp. NBRC 14428]
MDSWRRDYLDEALVLARVGEHDEAAAMLRSHVDHRAGWDDRAPELAFLLRDEEMLRRLAGRSDLAVVRLAELLIAARGVEAAEAEIEALPVHEWRSPPRISFARALARTGHVERALAIARETTAAGDLRLTLRGEELLADLHGDRGDLDALREAYEKHRSSAAGNVLARLLWERGDREAVRRLAMRRVSAARELLVRPAAEAADHRTLLDLVYLGSRTARGALIPLLDRLGDRSLLTALAHATDDRDPHAPDVHEDWALAEALLRHGLDEEALPVLRATVPQYAFGNDQRRLAELTDARELYRHLWKMRYGALTGVPEEALTWVALAIGSGVLGNAAYSALSAAVSGLWQRVAARGEAAHGAPAPSPRPGGTPRGRPSTPPAWRSTITARRSRFPCRTSPRCRANTTPPTAGGCSSSASRTATAAGSSSPCARPATTGGPS